MDKTINATDAAPEGCETDPSGASLNPFCKDVALMTTIYVYMRLVWGVMAVCGNVLTILAVVRYTELRTLTNAFIVSLASADLINGLLAAPLLAAEEFHRVSDHWKDLCLVFNFFTLLTAGCNIANICAISVERYIYIHHPLTYYHIVTPCRVGCAIAIIWTSVALEVAMSLVFTCPFDNRSVCDARVIVQTGVYYFLVISSFVLPSLVTLFMYIRITITAFRQARQIVNLSVRPSTCQASHDDFEMIERSQVKKPKSNETVAIHSQSNNVKSAVEVDKEGNKKTNTSNSQTLIDHKTTEAWSTPKGKAKDTSDSTKETVAKTASDGTNDTICGELKQDGLDAPMHRQQMRLTKMLGLLLGLYLVLNLPAVILSPFVQHLSDDTGEVIRIASLLLLYANSWANPLLYAWKARDFRRAFSRLLRFRE